MQTDSPHGLDTWRCDCGATGLLESGRVPFVMATREGSVRRFIVILDGEVIHRCNESRDETDFMFVATLGRRDHCRAAAPV